MFVNNRCHSSAAAVTVTACLIESNQAIKSKQRCRMPVFNGGGREQAGMTGRGESFMICGRLHRSGVEELVVSWSSDE